jgi:hypothetical protein
MGYAVTAAFLVSVIARSFATVILGGYGIAQLIVSALYARPQTHLEDQHRGKRALVWSSRRARTCCVTLAPFANKGHHTTIQGWLGHRSITGTASTPRWRRTDSRIFGEIELSAHHYPIHDCPQQVVIVLSHAACMKASTSPRGTPASSMAQRPCQRSRPRSHLCRLA